MKKKIKRKVLKPLIKIVQIITTEPVYVEFLIDGKTAAGYTSTAALFSNGEVGYLMPDQNGVFNVVGAHQKEFVQIWQIGAAHVPTALQAKINACREGL